MSLIKNYISAKLRSGVPDSKSAVRTEDIGYTSNWADALEKCVTDGTKRAICEFGGQRSLYGDAWIGVENSQ